MPLIPLLPEEKVFLKECVFPDQVVVTIDSYCAKLMFTWRRDCEFKPLIKALLDKGFIEIIESKLYYSLLEVPYKITKEALEYIHDEFLCDPEP